eukprot:scaffold663005_cov61-Prasinocladus_malaysianus.AAC.1
MGVREAKRIDRDEAGPINPSCYAMAKEKRWRERDSGPYPYGSYWIATASTSTTFCGYTLSTSTYIIEGTRTVA